MLKNIRNINQNTLWVALAFVFFWNSGFIGAEYGLPYSGPFTLLFWRYLALTLLLFLYLYIRRRHQWVGWQVAGWHMLVGILAHGGWLSCVLLALNHGVPAGIVALVVALQPLATGAFSGLVTRESTSILQWVGLVVGFVGVALPVGARIDFQDAASVFGYLVPMGSVIAITVASLLQRRMEVRQSATRLSLDRTLFYQALGTALALALPALLVESMATQWTIPFLYAMAWLIIAVSLGAYALMWALLERLDATRVASLFYLGPPVTMLMAWIAFGDEIQFVDVMGLLVVLVGVLVAQVPKTTPQKV